MVEKYDTFLQEMLKKHPDDTYWKDKYQEFTDSLEEGYIPEPVQEFHKHLQCIFSNGDSIQEVLAYCYDELPIIQHKHITFGSKDILECHLNSTITVDYDKQEILVEDLPIHINGYSLFKLTVGVM